MERTKGTPQGGVVSPLLANLFLHYAFDRWMDRNYPGVRFERYADDAIVHCRSEEEARSVLDAIRGRFAECGLKLHPEKTRIVYCKEDDRPGSHEHITFDFLDYTFQPRRAKNRWGKYFIGFLPAISNKAAKAIRQTIREWRMASTRNNQRLEDLARLTNPAVRGWMNYYGRFYRSKCIQVLRHLNEALARWAQRKFKRFKRRERASMHWLGRIARRDPNLFVLWQFGVRPEAGVQEPDEARVSRPVVCPAKAGMFSKRKACRGKNQNPVVWIAGWRETEDSEAYRQRLPRGGDESPGRNNSERKSGLESE